MPSRDELKKCVGQPCLSFAELDSELKLSVEYFKPLACVDICIGENVGEYIAKIGYSSYFSQGFPKEIISDVNSQMATALNPKCKACVDYINSANYKLIQNDDYSVLAADFNKNLDNDLNLKGLADFSQNTKFSFLNEIIECKSFDELISLSGKNIDSLAFVFSNSTQNGTFILMNANYNAIFKIIGLEYTQNAQINPTKSYSITSLVKSEKLKNDIVFGGQ
jgi:hypothetical protein